MQNTIEIDPIHPESILNTPLYNKGSAFTAGERDELKLHGHLPYHVSTIEEQVYRRYQNFISQPNQLSKFLFLSSLQNRNEVLFYRLVYEHIAEMLPFIYTPTVGDVSLQYSMHYKEHRGIYLSYPTKDKMDEIFRSVQTKQIDVIVVTDGERVLGLGDMGIGGMAIPVGKLSLYTLFGGIHPSRTLPIMLDVGTNNKELLNDPHYMGWRHERMSGKEYDDFVDQFVTLVKKTFPHVLLQWEDFARPHARPLLERYQDAILSFNDDIQGTAAVTLSAVLAATKQSGKKLKDQKIAILGGGSAGLGIASKIVEAMMEEGLSKADALKNFYIVDIHGLIHKQMSIADEEQKIFAQDYSAIQSWKVKDTKNISLLEVVHNAKPSVLIGVSTKSNAFTEEIIKLMASHTPRPIILPLSNPTSCSEAKPEDVIRWTEGRAILATGSPFHPVDYKGRLYAVAQCNNVCIFPGVGLGVVSVKAKKVSNKMFVAAAKELSEHAPILKDEGASLFPSFEDLREISKKIAFTVAKVAIEEGYAEKLSDDKIKALIDQNMWFPQYPMIKLKKK